MTKKSKINKVIAEKIKQNISRLEIAEILSSQYKEKEYRRILNDYPEPELLIKYRKIYLALIISLIVILFGKVSLLVLIINESGLESGLVVIAFLSLLIYVMLLGMSLTGRANAYKVNIVYMLYALFTSTETYSSLVWVDIAIILTTLGTSVFLLLTTFPRLSSPKTVI